MNHLNQIESDHIARLKPHELATLLRLLLYAEAKHQPASVHVPLQINVPDDGEDGRWQATQEMGFPPLRHFGEHSETALEQVGGY